MTFNQAFYIVTLGALPSSKHISKQSQNPYSSYLCYKPLLCGYVVFCILKYGCITFPPKNFQSKGILSIIFKNESEVQTLLFLQFQDQVGPHPSYTYFRVNGPNNIFYFFLNSRRRKLVYFGLNLYFCKNTRFFLEMVQI